MLVKIVKMCTFDEKDKVKDNLLDTSIMDFNSNNTLKDKQTFDLYIKIIIFYLISSKWLCKLTQLLSKNLDKKIFYPLLYITKKTVFKHFCGGEAISECKESIQILHDKGITTTLDYSVENTDITSMENTQKEIIRTIQHAKQNTHISFCVFKVTGLIDKQLLEKYNFTKSNTKDKIYTRGIDRIDKICKTAKEHNVKIFIDAEESWIQNSIDNIALYMMQKYNTERCIVYNTFQMYRKDRLVFLKQNIEYSKKHNFYLGIKLVRGCYIEKEKHISIEKGYTNPIFDTKQMSDDAYNDALKHCFENITFLDLCVATHNEESTLLTIQLMKDHSIKNSTPKIYFAHLMGMCDYMSVCLAKNGYNVTKYMPYGPILETIPYLTRRLEENSSIKHQSLKEISFIKQELRKRKYIWSR